HHSRDDARLGRGQPGRRLRRGAGRGVGACLPRGARNSGLRSVGLAAMGTPQSSAGDTGSARPVLVVDFGAQYAQLIARRVREAHVYSEIVPHDTPVAQLLARDPAAIVLSGGPASVYEPGAPRVDPALFSAGVPVFGICYGFQAMAQGLGGSVAHTGQREFGGTDLRLRAGGGALLGGLPEEQTVWMSHGDCVTNAPEGFTVTASTDRAPVAAFEDRGRRLAGVQFHPGVAHP